MTHATLPALQSALELVHEVFGPTPFYRWPLLCQRVGTEVWVKHENHTPTGAFKIRGGLLYMSKLKQLGQQHGVIAASTGNHGQSLAVAGKHHAIPVQIVVPTNNSPEKNALMRAQGAELVEHGTDFQDAFEYASQEAAANGLFMMPSFDETLVCGVGTYALEFFRAQPDLDAVYVPVGLGSGICGVISARDALNLNTKIYGVVATGAPAYKLSFDSHRAISTNTVDTFAAGVSCRVPVPSALEMIWAGAEDIVAVNDDEIRSAIGAYFTDTHNAVEGAGACSLAALMRSREQMRGKKVGLVLSGGNIDKEDLVAILSQSDR